VIIGGFFRPSRDSDRIDGRALLRPTDPPQAEPAAATSEALGDWNRRIPQGILIRRGSATGPAAQRDEMVE